MLFLLLPGAMNDRILTEFDQLQGLQFFLLEHTPPPNLYLLPTNFSPDFQNYQVHLRAYQIFSPGYHKKSQAQEVRSELILPFQNLLVNCHHHPSKWSKEVLKRPVTCSCSVFSTCLTASDSYLFATLSNQVLGPTHCISLYQFPAFSFTALFQIPFRLPELLQQLQWKISQYLVLSFPNPFLQCHPINLSNISPLMLKSNDAYTILNHLYTM